jgi:hypothetical protein
VRKRYHVADNAMKKAEKDKADIKVEPGANKRLANILRRALNTPARHVEDKRKKATKEK